MNATERGQMVSLATALYDLRFTLQSGSPNSNKTGVPLVYLPRCTTA